MMVAVIGYEQTHLVLFIKDARKPDDLPQVDQSTCIHKLLLAGLIRASRLSGGLHTVCKRDRFKPINGSI